MGKVNSSEDTLHELRELSLAIEEAGQKERDRLARILHDDLQQDMVAAQFKASKIAEGDLNAEAMQAEARSIIEILTEALAASRRLSIELSPPILDNTSVIEVVRWLADWFGDRFQMSVTVHAPENLPPVKSKVRLVLFQTVRELLFNVIKHSGQRSAEVRMDREGDYITILVKNSGHGFDPGILQDGLNQGLGLKNIQQRLAAIKGRWEIDSLPGGGARFRLWFPVNQTAYKEVAEEVTPQKSVIRLLAVDDHKMVREGIVSLLESEPDIEVVGEAKNGKNAIAMAARLRPDVVLMDIEMPDVDGIEATRTILERNPDILVVGLSMHGDEDYSRKMRQAGAAALEDKVEASTQLIETIRRVFKNK